MTRPPCPSCHARVTPLALECPVCGLALPRRPLPRPLLFQASALRAPAPAPKGERQSLSVPALGRVEPLPLVEPPPGDPLALPPIPAVELRTPAAPESDLLDAFWPVVRMEAGELACLLALNLIAAMAACLASGVFPARLYGEMWAYLVPLHLTLSWAYLMVPLVLVGQSPMMALLRLAVDADQPERRMAFSLLHLVSSAAFPVSFLCMVLTPDHRTLAELLSGQEILQVPSARLR
ncbi:hypothetical protein [Mesoterricola sediminis]|uniref:Uncharacterized protein n=1 Tax=Mesoterricola sediminis TaxID=2927980 RepID=A0AA48HAA6_9BACT|nr:hypothetical protein [Mesoterricola sediminis]BDU78793.1 hypothetical protein METESE_37510 [Mesoterricola sediminis]